jgi:ribulose-phosphate 3-epimerase
MISVSFLKSKYDRYETLKKIDESICDYIHVDLMDGIYAGEKNFTIDSIINDLKDLKKPLDIHIMVMNPEVYINDLAKLHPKRITFHLNTTDNIYNVIDLIKEYNIEVGIAINPDENIHLIDEYLDRIDYVLIMSVYPGKGGQEFIPEVLSKVEYLNNKNVLIGIDGGINDTSINYLKDYHVDNIISGSFICMSDNYNMQLEKINIKC